MLDGKEGDGVQDVDIDCCTISKIGGLDANVCRYKFGELTGTYIGEFYFSPDVLAHLLYLYALGYTSVQNPCRQEALYWHTFRS